MNIPTHFQVAIKTDRGKKHFPNQNPDTVPERASFNEPRQPPSTVWPYVLDNDTLDTFIGSAGI